MELTNEEKLQVTTKEKFIKAGIYNYYELSQEYHTIIKQLYKYGGVERDTQRARIAELSNDMDSIASIVHSTRKEVRMIKKEAEPVDTLKESID